jgi:iron complex transport system permease protein
MKIILDLSRLVEEGKLTSAEAERLRALAAQDTGSLAINILVGLGVVAVAGGAIALVPEPLSVGVIGVTTLAIGAGLVLAEVKQWSVFANILVLAGALMLGGGIVWLGDGSAAAFLAAAAMFTAAGVLARSGLLVAGAVLALSCALGARTGYRHASYMLGIDEPILTILLFSAVALTAYLVSKRVGAGYEALALTAARTAVFLVNFGFWIGSLWGDRLRWLRPLREGAADADAWAPVIPDWAFVIAWAVVLIAAGAWAVQANRRWVVTIVAIFGAIHFYTQWFERLGATPASVLVGGLITLAGATAIWMMRARKVAPA